MLFRSILCAATLLMTVGCSSGSETSSGSSEPDASGISGTADVSGAPDAETNESGAVSEEDIMDSLNNGIIIDSVSGNVYKNEMNANPISPNIFCADPITSLLELIMKLVTSFSSYAVSTLPI